jgi:hypothetical protein
MARIDKRTLLRELTKIVKADPDKVAQCTYAVDDEPHCVAGVWFAQHKVDVADLPNDTASDILNVFEAPADPNQSWNDSRIRAAFATFDAEGLSKGATRLLTFIQAVQDERFEHAARIVTDAPSYTKTSAAWVKKAQQSLSDPSRPTWSEALALTKANYSAF